MNNQQHSMMTSMAGSNQRGVTTYTKPVYQRQQMSNMSHLQQQQPSQMMSSYSPQQQKPSDLSSRQYPPSMANMNGTAYQHLTGSSIHSNYVDNNPINVQHTQATSHQYSQPQHPSHQQHQHFQSNMMNQHQQQQYPSQTSLSQQQQAVQSHQYTMHQGCPNQQQATPQHSHKQMHQQRQPYVHVPQQQQQQQNVQQEPNYERVQLQRRILQNTNHVGQRSNPRPVAKEPSGCNPESVVCQPKEAPVQNDAIVDDSVENDEENAIEEDNSDEITDNSGSAAQNKELANTKEKTPMTLVQELAKFNKIERKYTLLDEQGPAHKKTFFVKLQLGTEEYQSSGASIRKAQQSAAAIALRETNFKHPLPKPAWKTRKEPKVGDDGKLTPTVELNTLAMRRGEAATYKAIEPQQPPYYYPPGMDPRAMYNPRYYHYMRASRDPRYARGYWPMRYHYPRMSRAYYVSLHVGHREFIGDGPTRQAARNNAAAKALNVLKKLPEKVVKVEDPEPDEEEEDDEADGTKSRVTSVHEIAFRRKLAVSFEVIRECGPAHMKMFITRCSVGDMVTEGEGKSKKIAKKIASEQMYEKLKELPPLPPSAVKPKPKTQFVKKKNRIKCEIQQQKADPNYGVGVNPISRLIQIMCAQKKKEPVYTLVTERGISCRKEFIMQIEVEGKTCTGSGPNKKLAKRSAAEAMLELLGYNKPSPQPTKSSIKQPSSEGSSSNNGEKKVTFSENCHKGLSELKVSQSGHQQKVPGLLHLPANTVVSTPVTPGSSITLPSSTNPKESLVNLSTILKPNWRPELQLRELCKALNYPLEIDDFTKSQQNNSVEYISRINIGPTESQQNFLGSSSTVESARDMACMDALKVLVSRVKDMHPAGDGSPHIKKSVLSRNSPGLREIPPQ